MRPAHARGFCAAALAGLLVWNGCATAFRGHSEKITIESEPSGASVRLGNGFTGRTPASFVVPRKGDLVISVSMEGYEAITVVLRPTISGGVVVGGAAGNTVTAVGTGVVVSSSVTVTGAGAMAGSASVAVAQVAAVTAGAVALSGMAIDFGSGAMLSHASGPIRFVLRPVPATPP